jgi:phosphohistidine phosphatase
MKKLFLVRHAKSSRSIADLEDFDRPLNERGYSDAHMIGLHLKKETVGSLIIISSPAIRALSTALIFGREINYEPEKIIMRRDLYETDAYEYLKVIREQEDKYDSMIIVGHNPTITDVNEKLNGNFIGDVPTCAVSIFTIKTEKWSDILTAERVLSKFIIPADFKEKATLHPEN